MLMVIQRMALIAVPNDIPLALFQLTSLIFLITQIHSQTFCTSLGGFANDLISVISEDDRLFNASRANSNAGRASARADSASTLSFAICY